MKVAVSLLVGVLAGVLAAPSAQADPEAELEPEPERPRTPFDRGRFNLGFGAGSQSNFGERYFVVGGAAGYFVLDGFELGLGAAHQFGDGPSITRLTPALRYVAHPLVGRSPVVPYAGVFYSHYFVGDAVADIDTAGVRGGLLYVSGSVILGLGIAHERQISECATNCSWFYPDFTLAIAL